MTDVDAIRWMAIERDLEFVDLDTYGVDPAASEILPASLSRQHHVVAIKRKFGTPVIATADPDDMSAQDTVRASIGRDFISVVASRDQISDYLDQLFGPEGDAEQPAAGFEDPGGVPAAEKDESPVDLVSITEPSVVDDEDPGSPQPEATAAGNDRLESTVEENATAPSNGKRRHRQGEGRSKQGVGRSKKSKLTADAGIGHFEVNDWTPLDVQPVPGESQSESHVHDAMDAIAMEAFALDTSVPDAVAADPLDAAPIEPEARDTAETVPIVGHSIDLVAEPVESTEPTWDASSATEDQDTEGESTEEQEVLEPATSLLPTFAEGLVTPDLPVSTDPSEAAVDPLAELARTVQSEEVKPAADSTAMAADLVAEAVATFQELQADEQGHEGTEEAAPTGIAMFPPLAKALVEAERVSLEDMEEVLDEHYRSGQSIARILTAQKLVTEADLMWGMAQEMGLEFVDLDTVGVDVSEAGTIPEATARHHNVVVIANDNGTPVVAASNPTDVFAMDDLRTIMGRRFIVVVATRTQISAYIGRVFNSGGDAADMAMEASLDFDGQGSDKGVDDIQSITEEAPIVRYVNLLVLQALNERASDIHVEPTATDLRIRYRIDGVLHDVSTAPRAISAAVTTRLKVMADMNVAEHRVPQDGRISLTVGSKGIDLRMATLPTIHGEKVVMRVLDKSSVVLGFADLGFDDDFLKTYEGLYTKPYGTILVTGPTGSGKSTTLYTTLTALNSPEKNIITVEDPVELQLKGVNQVQLNVKAGLTFASALKSILRSDPDIVLVGEIRDKETAVIAIEAALTGHMVLATLHTNSAAATPMRLIEMGLEPFLVTSSLSGVLAQRLARRLCMHCKEAYVPTEADIMAAGWTLSEVEAVGGMPKVFRAVGCSACANTGYRGRKAMAELLPMTEEIERLIIEGGSVDDIHKLAVSQGMLTLRQSGLRKAIEGETTLEEVLRVVA
jgi:type IV pilus assembly protein PilB